MKKPGLSILSEDELITVLDDPRESVRNQAAEELLSVIRDRNQRPPVRQKISEGYYAISLDNKAEDVLQRALDEGRVTSLLAHEYFEGVHREVDRVVTKYFGTSRHPQIMPG